MIRFLILALSLCLPGAAFAGLSVCNETDLRASVAIGYNKNKVWTSEGWWVLDPGKCATVVGGDLQKRYYYWHATNTNGAFAGESYAFCTTRQVFEIPGDTDCSDRGYDKSDFSQVDTGDARDYTIALGYDKAPSGSNSNAPKPSAPADYSAEPGTHGEPYTIVAEYLGCSGSGSGAECRFFADGWTYLAKAANPTAPSIFADLANFSSGSVLWLSGDMMSYSGDTAIITIRDFDIAPDDGPAAPPPVEAAGILDHVQGYWDNDQDDSYYLIVQGNQLDEIYDGNLMRRSFFEVHPSCAASDGWGPVIIAYPDPDEGDGPSCYVVTEMGQRSFALYDVIEERTLTFTYSN